MVSYESPCGVMRNWKDWKAYERFARYESPCGVMSCQSQLIHRAERRYESPCGVMSAQAARRCSTRKLLRIPMRGYETDNIKYDEDSAGSYESPCGVMSAAPFNNALTTIKLRIPMRGYERFFIAEMSFAPRVTNPHAGL